MVIKLSKALDDCIAKINKGETIETCLAEYPRIRRKLEPLLHSALSISAIPKVSPSAEFKRIAKARLMSRLRQEARQAAAAEREQGITLLDELAMAWQRLCQNVVGMRKVAIPVTAVILIALVAGLYGMFNFLSPPPALASQSTLSVLGGSVEVQKSTAEGWQRGADGMVLSAGARVKTEASSYALLTFSEGSTIKLEPDTDVEMQQVESTNGQLTAIILKQWSGKTWSRVIEKTDHDLHYQVQTPSASVIAHGTLFATEVEETGFTMVATMEGLVSVAAQGEEVYLPGGQQTQVEAGMVPSQPTAAPSPKAELVITIDMPAVGSVSDPTGSSTGYLPSGLSHNQITESQTSSPYDGTQLITIAEPVTGEYIVVLRYITEGVAHFSIQGKSDGEVAFTYAGEWGAEEESGWLISLNLQIEEGLIVNGMISGIEPLGDEVPENLVEAELAGEGVVPTVPTAEDGDITSGQAGGEPDITDEDKGKSRDEDKDTGRDEDKGTPGKDEDTGTGKDEDNGAPGKDEDTGTGKDEDTGTGKDEDNGAPGKSEDKGAPGKSEDKGTGKDEDKGAAGKSEDKGEPGKSEDKGNDGDKDNGKGNSKNENKGKNHD